MSENLKLYGIVSVNGEIKSLNEPVLPVLDQGFLYGYGVFDTLRVCKGAPFLVKRHIERLLASASSIYLNITGYEDKLPIWLEEFILRLEMHECIVRTTITKGTQDRPCVIITGRPLSYAQQQYEKGFSASVSAIRRNSKSPLSRIKSLNYLDNILAKKISSSKGYDEAIMLNERDLLCECSMSNLFFVSNGELYTPGLDCGVLNGITRDVVIEVIAPALLLSLSEGKFQIEKLLNADEAFLTNSAMGVMPLVSIDGHEIGKGKPGFITETIAKSYENLLTIEFSD